MSDALDDDWPAPLIRPEAIDTFLRRKPALGARPPSPSPSLSRTGRLPAQSVLAALVLIAAVWAATGFYKVEPDQVGIVLRFGKWVDTRSSGLNFHLPYPIETVLLPRVTQANQLKISNGAVTQMLTGDENIVEATAAVFWRIKDPAKYLFNVSDPEAMVRIAAESAVRQVIGLNPIQAGLSDQRQKIADDAQERLQKLLDAYDIGIAVTQVQLQRVDPPTAVIDAFNDVQRARADQERARNEAEAYSRDILPRARGDAERIKQESQAYREQVVNASTGDAARFLAVYGSYKDNHEVIARRLYLETMDEVLKAATKIVIDSSGTPGSPLLPYMPLPGPAGKAVP